MANATNKLPEGMRHDWNIKSWKANDIKDRLPDVLNQIQTLYDKAGSADIGNLTFDSFLQPILQAQRLTFGHFWWHGTAGTPITFPRLVAVEKEVRDAATAAGKAIDDLTLEMFMRKDIFERMVEYRKTCELDPEYVRFVDRMIVVGKGNGLELNEQHRNKVKLLKLEINNLVGEFDNRLIEDKTLVLFNESELAGLSEDFIKNLETDPQTGLKKLTMRYPTYLPVMRQCRIPDTRKKMSLAYTNRGGKRNEEIMQKVVQLRHECANLLGYENWATYRQEAYVAKDPKTVNSFLATLATQLQPLWKEEKEALLKLKAEECQKYGYEFNGDLDMWDLIYYCNLMEETEYSIDTEKLREYFPLDTVTTGLLGVYAHILGLEFTKLVDPPAWHDDVFAYKVNDRQSGELMGYVYMDLFPREGKFTHYANKPMQSGAVNEAGVKEKTITCMVCNFSPPTQGKPSLLTPSEVETYFHEFGHAMHAICSKAKVHMFWGTHVERDFVEAPSQMLENWVKERVILDRMSGHYQTGETMPNDEVDKMKKSDKASAGYSNLRQIVLATFDQRIHQNGSLNPRKVYSETMFEILGLAPHPDSFFPGAFSHVMNSYDAGYYSYMWSEMYSADMYETVFEKVGPLNTNAGMQYRQKILEKGGSVDALDMLRDFLGREPNDEAFMKHKGLTAEN